MRSKTGGRTRKVFERQVLDTNTGEIIESESVTVEIPIKGTEEFFVIFGGAIKAVFQLSGAAKDVFIWSGLHVGINTTSISLSKREKDQIAADTGLNPRTVDNAIQELTRKKVFIREGRGSYAINPKYAWKGKMNERAKAMKNMKLKLTFELEGDED